MGDSGGVFGLSVSSREDAVRGIRLRGVGRGGDRRDVDAWSHRAPGAHARRGRLWGGGGGR
jgi:hypothetical protein